MNSFLQYLDAAHATILQNSDFIMRDTRLNVNSLPTGQKKQKSGEQN